MTTLIERPDTPQNPASGSPTTVGRGKAALAGALAAAVALAVTEVVSVAVDRSGPSVVGAVAGRFVDRYAGSLKDVAVAWFGTNDKAALLVGIVVVATALGAVLGVVAARRFWLGAVGFAAFAVVGALAGRADPLASSVGLTVASLSGGAAGVVCLALLLRAAAGHLGRAPLGAVRPAAVDPRVKRADRRVFLTALGGAGAVAVVATATSKGMRGSSPAVRSRATTSLPAPSRSIAAPTSQPFAVDGLSPYVTPNDSFYRIDTAVFVPQVDGASWKLTIDGMVERPVTFTYADLLGMDMVEEPVTISCVSNEVGDKLVGNALWRGVPLKTLLDQAGVKPGATQVVGRSVDDFTVGFPTEKALDGRTAMVAVGMNGEPLPVIHGFPARLIVAGLYGYVSATKWLRKIELTRLEDFDAYWVPLGWAKQAPIKTQSRIDVPGPGTTVAAGPLAIAGVAWAPTRGIRAVEVSIDHGPWQPARLGDAASDNTWVQWLFSWDATPGAHVAGVRAIDGTGAVQIEKPSPPDPDGATGYHYRGFTVR